MFDSYHIYFKGEILFKNLSKDDFEFVWGKLYTSYINALNDELTFEIIRENSLKETVQNLEPSYWFNLDKLRVEKKSFIFPISTYSFSCLLDIKTYIICLVCDILIIFVKFWISPKKGCNTNICYKPNEIFCFTYCLIT